MEDLVFRASFTVFMCIMLERAYVKTEVGVMLILQKAGLDDKQRMLKRSQGPYSRGSYSPLFLFYLTRSPFALGTACFLDLSRLFLWP